MRSLFFSFFHPQTTPKPWTSASHIFSIKFYTEKVICFLQLYLVTLSMSQEPWLCWVWLSPNTNQSPSTCLWSQSWICLWPRPSLALTLVPTVEFPEDVWLVLMEVSAVKDPNSSLYSSLLAWQWSGKRKHLCCILANLLLLDPHFLSRPISPHCFTPSSCSISSMNIVYQELQSMRIFFVCMFLWLLSS